MLKHGIRYISIREIHTITFSIFSIDGNLSQLVLFLLACLDDFIYQGQRIKICSYGMFFFNIILTYSASCNLEVFCRKAEVCIKVAVRTNNGLCLIMN